MLVTNADISWNSLKTLVFVIRNSMTEFDPKLIVSLNMRSSIAVSSFNPVLLSDALGENQGHEDAGRDRWTAPSGRGGYLALSAFLDAA